MGSYALASLFYLGTSLRLRRHSGDLLVRYKTSFSSFATVIATAPQTSEQLLVVVGGGAAGIYASIIAKQAAPHLNVLVVEKGKLLSKVKISGGGRCNVTNGHLVEKKRLADNYPRGNKELRGYFFDIHGPEDTMRWFCDHGVELKTEEDGRVFPVSNSSASVVDCLLHEAKRTGVSLQTGKVVSDVSANEKGKFRLKIERRTADYVEYVEADYALIATGSSKQGYALAIQVGHSIVEPMPSLFTFKIDDTQLACLSGITFPKVKAKLKLESTHRSIPELSQVGPMLVTHWGLSGPVILRLSAWGARDLFLANYTGILNVDFIPDIHIEDVKHALFQHREQFALDPRMPASSRAVVLISGEGGTFFRVKRGLKQGCALSPLFFIMTADCLCISVKRAVRVGLLSGIGAYDSWEISSLQFIDNTLIFYEASMHEAKLLRLLLFCFQLMSGLCVNLYKSSSFYIGREERKMELLEATLCYDIGVPPTSYLRITFSDKALPRRS